MRRCMIVAFTMLALLAVLFGCGKPAPSPTAAPKPTATIAPGPAPAPASTSAADFFKNNTTNIVVGWGAGGGTDFAARLVASFWADVTGGDARVKNMPGGGGLVAGNYVWKAKPDGLTLLVCNKGSELTGRILFKEPGVEFDITKFNYIGLFGDEPSSVAVAKDGKYKSVADLQKAKGLRFGASSRISGPSLGSMLAFHLLGITDGTVVLGSWKSTPETALAIAKGELEGYCYADSTVAADVDKGWVKPIVTIERQSTLFTDIPPISQVVKVSPEDAALLKIYDDAFGVGRVFLAPPGMPQDRVQYLRDTFDKMMKLDGLRQLAISRYRAFNPPTNGKDTAKMINDALGVSQKDLGRLDELADKYIK